MRIRQTPGLIIISALVSSVLALGFFMRGVQDNLTTSKTDYKPTIPAASGVLDLPPPVDQMDGFMIRGQGFSCGVGGCKLDGVPVQLDYETEHKPLLQSAMDRTFENLVLRGTLIVSHCDDPKSFCRPNGNPYLRDADIVSVEFLCDTHSGRAFVASDEEPIGRIWLCELPSSEIIPEYQLK